MIDGVPHVLPNPKESLVGVESPKRIDYEPVRVPMVVDLAAQFAAEGVGDAGSLGQPRPRHAIYGLCPKQFVAGRAHIVEL